VTLPVVWLHAARTEYYDALRWYFNIGTDLGKLFAQAVEDTQETIAQFPLRFPVVHKGRRKAGVRRFPYGLFYLVEDTRIVVIACFHGKRNPRVWQRR
jgi:toxin ParE1/3/4